MFFIYYNFIFRKTWLKGNRESTEKLRKQKISNPDSRKKRPGTAPTTYQYQRLCNVYRHVILSHSETYQKNIKLEKWAEYKYRLLIFFDIISALSKKPSRQLKSQFIVTKFWLLFDYIWLIMNNKWVMIDDL